MQMNEVVNIREKYTLFNELWTPKIVGECNGQLIKIAKVKGEFVWHSHKEEDELFLIIKGELSIEFKDKTIVLKEGEFYIVPKGVEHRPFAKEECHVLLIELASTKHTGDVKHSVTKNNQDFI